jgi:hypothetical protein
MKKSAAALTVLIATTMFSASPAFSATFSPLNISVSATGQLTFTPTNGSTSGSIACNVVLSGTVNSFGNVVFTSGSVSGVSGCSSIKVLGSSTTTNNALVPVSSSQVSATIGYVDEPQPLRILFECNGVASAEWNNATSQVVFNSTSVPSCLISGALTISPSVTIQ